MGMSNEEIAKLMADGELDDSVEEEAEDEVEETAEESEEPVYEISQEDMDSLLSGFVSEDSENKEDLLDEIYEAILDSGKLSLMQWVKLRERLREIEDLIPHIDLIIRLKSKNEKKLTDEERD